MVAVTTSPCLLLRSSPADNRPSPFPRHNSDFVLFIYCFINRDVFLNTRLIIYKSLTLFKLLKSGITKYKLTILARLINTISKNVMCHFWFQVKGMVLLVLHLKILTVMSKEGKNCELLFSTAFCTFPQLGTLFSLFWALLSVSPHYFLQPVQVFHLDPAKSFKHIIKSLSFRRSVKYNCTEWLLLNASTASGVLVL